MTTTRRFVGGFAVLLMALVAAAAAPAVTGNGAPNGPHYNLNIIGVPKDKTADMTGANGHVIFVKLEGHSKIWLAEGDFQVLDANGTDADGARFQLPDPVSECVTDPDTGEYKQCTTWYSVFARAPGKSGGSASMKTCGTSTVDPTTGEVLCSVQILEITQSQKFKNVTKYLLFVYADVDDDGDVELIPIFDDRLEGYYWSYDNNGLKLLQLRFYPCATTVFLDGTQESSC